MEYRNINEEDNDYHSFSILKILISFVLIFLSAVIIEFVITGIDPEAIDPKKDTFSGNRANEHWKNITSVFRDEGTEGYNYSHDYIMQKLNIYKAKADALGVLNVTIEKQYGVANETAITRTMHSQKDVRNILVDIRVKGDERAPIAIIAHIDGNALGPAAYDDAAGVSCMLELIQAITESDTKIKNPVLFFFDGTEEQGLHGALLFARHKKNISSFLNIESMGQGLPLALMQKGDNPYAIIKAYTKAKRTIFATFADDVTQLGLISSSSDAVVFRDLNIAGAEVLYVGNPTRYHTMNDSMLKSSHLQLLGDQLYTVINSFDYSDEKVQAGAIGIYPLVMFMKRQTANIIDFCCLGVAVIITVLLIVKKQLNAKENYKSILLNLFSFILTFGVMMLLPLALYYFNSLSYAFNPLFALISLTSLGMLLFFFFTSLLKVKSYSFDYQFILIVLDGIFMFVCRNFDFAYVLIFRFVLSLIGLIFIKKFQIISLICNIIGTVPITFFIYMTFRVLIRYTSMIPGFIGECVPVFIIVLYLLLMLISLIPVITTKKEEKSFIKFIYLGLALVLILVFLFLPLVYSDSYYAQGTIAQIFTDNHSSVLSFAPEGGERVLRMHSKKKYIIPGVKYDYNYERPFLTLPAFTEECNASIPDFIKKWPILNITVKNLSANNYLREVHVKVPESNENFHRLHFVIKCGSVKCLEKVEGFDNPVNFFTNEKKDGFKYYFKVTPAFLPAEMNFTVSGLEKIPLTFAFTSYNFSKELTDFNNKMPYYFKYIINWII